MLSDLDNIASTNVDDGAADTLGGFNDDIVVFGHMERVECLDLFSNLVQDTFINGVRYAVVDQLRQDQPVFAVVEHLEGISRKRQHMANVGIAGKDGIDMGGEGSSLL